MEETVLAWDPRTVRREDLINHLSRSLFAELELTIARVLDNAEMRRSNALYKRQLAARQGSGLIGNSAAILALESLIDAVAPTNATVLIHGESGSGKEVVASAIHQRSERKDKAAIHAVDTPR